MLTFVRTARIEPWFGRWQALVTFADDGMEESHFIAFGREQPAQQDADAAGAALAASMNAQRADDDLERMVLQGTVSLRYQTGAQLAARFRAKFAAASQEQAARMAKWLLARVAAGDFTDTQVRAVFGMTTTQYTAAKARMQALADNWSAVENARGE